jgi:hypothetical protein
MNICTAYLEELSPLIANGQLSDRQVEYVYMMVEMLDRCGGVADIGVLREVCRTVRDWFVFGTETARDEHYRALERIADASVLTTTARGLC